MTPVRILHLEDDANDAELLAIHLAAQERDWPHQIIQVQTQAEFSKALAESVFDVILADNSGPGFSGLDALTLAREKHPQAVFLFVSGYSESGPDAAAMKTRSDGYVVKHQLQTLVPAIQRALTAKKK